MDKNKLLDWTGCYCNIYSFGNGGSCRRGLVRLLKYLLIIVFLVLIGVIYSIYDPAEHTAFPQCPFRTLTGYKCPGCGSQRAIHELLHGNVSGAFYYNMLLVISIPYLLVAFLFDLVKNPGPEFLKWRKRLFGKNAIFIVLGIIVLFWLLRNTNLLN